MNDSISEAIAHLKRQISDEESAVTSEIQAAMRAIIARSSPKMLELTLRLKMFQEMVPSLAPREKPLLKLEPQEPTTREVVEPDNKRPMTAAETVLHILNAQVRPIHSRDLTQLALDAGVSKPSSEKAKNSLVKLGRVTSDKRYWSITPDGRTYIMSIGQDDQTSTSKENSEG